MKIVLIVLLALVFARCIPYKKVHTYPVEKRKKILHKKAISDIKKINRYKKIKRK